MGGRFSHVHYRAQDAVVVAHFQLLTQVWGLSEIEFLSLKLRGISFNFCLTNDQFAEWLALQHDATASLFHGMLQKWFTTFKNTKSSSVVNGLEILSTLAISSTDGKLIDKLGTVFDIFDFDESKMITFDELNILIKSVVRGLSKITVGLGPRLVAVCPMAEVSALARQCFRDCDLQKEDDLPRESFIQWVKQTPKLVNLMRCFVRHEFITEDEAAATIQRCARGMQGRKVAADFRLTKQLELEREVHQAAQTIQEAVVARKKKRDTMRQMKIEKYAHHGALYTFGSNERAQLGHSSLKHSKEQVYATPLLVSFFKDSELRVVDGALSSVHAAVVASNGDIFTWGCGAPGSFGFLSRRQEEESGDSALIHKSPTRVQDMEDTSITACALGNHHSVALSESGVVYTWGSGSFGQLGHGDFNTDSHNIFKQQFDQRNGREFPLIDLPLQIDRSFFEEMHVLQVACGYYFTVALCEDGSVFTWGEGSDGQLGLGYSEHFQVGFLDEHIHGSSFVYMHTPTRVNDLKEPIGSIAVGGNHVFAVARDRKNVFEWGAWHHRGADTQESAFAPQLNDHLSSLAVSQIASGKEHALAITARVHIKISIDERAKTGASVEAFGLCATFGAMPVSLTRALKGMLLVYGCSNSAATASQLSSAGQAEMSGSAISAMLSSTVLERKDSHIRSSLSGCVGKIVCLERGMWTGHWILVPLATGSDSSASPHAKTLLEIPVIPAAFGPQLTERGITTKVWYSPEKLQSLRLYVRPDEVVGRVVVLEFDVDDVTFDTEDLELSEMITLIMISLVEKVKDAQECGAAAVVVIFDFINADAFPLEASEDEDFEFTIPVVMVKKVLHGELLLDQIVAPTAKATYAALCQRDDILSKQILTAQKNGAKAVVVAQNRIEQHPIRLRKAIFEVGQAKASDAAGIKIPVVSVPFETGEKIKQLISIVDANDSTAELGLGGPGQLYAWGYGENGRVGLGDIENEEFFETGFDGARQTQYQFVSRAAIVPTLFFKQITHIACGEDHSAAVSADGVLYTWGSGRNGKLGNGSESDELTPHPVEALSSVRVAKAVCGPEQTKPPNLLESPRRTPRTNMARGGGKKKGRRGDDSSDDDVSVSLPAAAAKSETESGKKGKKGKDKAPAAKLVVESHEEEADPYEQVAASVGKKKSKKEKKKGNRFAISDDDDEEEETPSKDEGADEDAEEADPYAQVAASVSSKKNKKKDKKKVAFSAKVEEQEDEAEEEEEEEEEDAVDPYEQIASSKKNKKKDKKSKKQAFVLSESDEEEEKEEEDEEEKEEEVVVVEEPKDKKKKKSKKDAEAAEATSADDKKKKSKKKKISTDLFFDPDPEEAEEQQEEVVDKKDKKKKKNSKLPFDEDREEDGDEEEGKEKKKKKDKDGKRLSNKDRKRLKEEQERQEREEEYHRAANPMDGQQFAVSQQAFTQDSTWENATDIHIDNFTINAHNKVLFENASLHINAGAKYGLVGPNGQGKTTLLKMIALGELKIPPKIDCLYVEQEVVADETRAVDAVLKADAERWALLEEEKFLLAELENKQDPALDERLNEVYEQLSTMNASAAEARARRILHGLGFDPDMQEKPTQDFSGGWRMRISLAKALYVEPTLLMLDEPTNHLDLNAVIWLDDYLQKWKKTLLVVSHDADFLNSVCTEVLHLESRKIVHYKGNYDLFRDMEKTKRKQAEKAWEKQQKQLKNLKASGNSSKKATEIVKKKREPGARANKTKSLADEQSKAEAGPAQLLERPKEYLVKFSFPETTYVPPPILEVRESSFQYGDGPYLFKNVDFGIDTNSRVCIVGPNGVGKSTLLKMITGEVRVVEGEVRRNPRVRIGVYNQHFVDKLPMGETPVEYLRRLFQDETYQSVRNLLGKVGLEGHAHEIKNRQLSGGQKARVVIAELVLMQPHILILDEPTNNLDIESIDALCDAIREYDGGVVIVTHDARLIETTECILWVVGDQDVVEYDGSFAQYRQSILDDLAKRAVVEEERLKENAAKKAEARAAKLGSKLAATAATE